MHTVTWTRQVFFIGNGYDKRRTSTSDLAHSTNESKLGFVVVVVGTLRDTTTTHHISSYYQGSLS
jgi:hypothetical protein